MKKFKFNKAEKIFLLLALIVFLGVFISSSMTYHQQEIHPGLMHRRFAFIENMVANLNIPYGGVWHNIHSDGKAGLTEFVMRKTAHFGSYFLLGLFSFFGFKRVFKVKFLAPFFVWLSVTGLAAFDEFHQFLTGDRTPSVHDVVLDSTGCLLAIIIAEAILLIKKQKK